MNCEDPNTCSLKPRGIAMDGYSEKDYTNLPGSEHVFVVKATDGS